MAELFCRSIETKHAEKIFFQLLFINFKRIESQIRVTRILKAGFIIGPFFIDKIDRSGNASLHFIYNH